MTTKNSNIRVCVTERERERERERWERGQKEKLLTCINKTLLNAQRKKRQDSVSHPIIYQHEHFVSKKHNVLCRARSTIHGGNPDAWLLSIGRHDVLGLGQKRKTWGPIQGMRGDEERQKKVSKDAHTRFQEEKKSEVRRERQWMVKQTKQL